MKLRLISAVCCLMALTAFGAEPEAGFVSLFNGRNLDGWDGAAGYWRVEDGAITGETTKERPLSYHTYLIWRGGEVADFELRLSFRLVSGNSGVQYRSTDLGNHVVAGYQCNIQTAKAGRTAILEEMKKGRGGILAHIGEQVVIEPDGKRTVKAKLCDPATVEAIIDRRGWNTLTIIAKGDRLIHKLNGQVVTDAVDRETGKAASRGILALQLHSGKPMKVQFKDIRLRKK